MESLTKSQVRDQRRVELKLDCVDSIGYTSWDPGHEYLKTFVVKNIATKVQILRWEPPVSPYFEVQFQEPHAKLGPMMTAAINIAFRPAALENYTSSIQFRTLRGQFVLNLKGLLPTINLGIPPAVDFEYGPVNDITEKTFLMKNTSDITVTYEWSVEPPFSIHPTQSTIQRGKSEMVYCRFQPTKAAAFSTMALCCTYLGVHAKLQLKGIGKYSFLAIPTPLLAFGEIVVRTTKEMMLVVTNISIVPAKFQVVKVENKLCKTDANIFNIIPMNGVIKANSSLAFKVIFTPITAGNFSVEKFEIHTCQTCRASFACTGTAARPVVKLSTFSLDFGSVESGGYVSRSVLLDNQSIVPVHFQFMTDDMSVFEFLQTRAVCRPNRATMITVHFRPRVIANYYKRVLIIIQDQHALYCDLLGNCCKVALKSPTLFQYHVDQHRELLKVACAEVQVVADQDKAHFPAKKSILGNLRPYFQEATASPKLIKKGLSGTEWESHPGAWHTMLEAPKWAEDKTISPAHPTSPTSPLSEVGKKVTFEPGSDPRHVDKFAPNAANLTNFFLNPLEGSSPQGPHHRTSAQQRELAEQLLETKSGQQQNFRELQNGDGNLDNNDVDQNEVPQQRKARLDSRYLVFSKTWQHGMEGYKNMYHHEIWAEYFIGRLEYWEPVTIDTEVFDFGLGKCMQLSEPQFLHVHNNVHTPVTLLWMAPQQPKTAEFKGIKPGRQKPTAYHDHELKGHTFHVVPDKAIIPVGGSYTFSIIFEPKEPNNHYCQFLQLFVWTPSIDRVLPPWTMLVCAAGHSFETHSQEFLPEYSVSKTRVNFPPVLKGFSVHQTIILRNHNVTVPLSFIFQLKDFLPEFVVKPEQGLIPPGEFQLITFRYDAGEPQRLTNNVQCVLNHSLIDNPTFILNGSSHVPKLVLEKNGVARFKPTSIGTRTTLYITLSSDSAIATEFEWQVPECMCEIFVIRPISGLLRPGESVNVSICFLPQVPKLFYCNIPCRAFAHVEKAYIKDNGMAIENVATKEVNRIQLIANGEGVVETIRIEPEILDYGFIVVGFSCKANLTLRNLSAGSLRYELGVTFPTKFVEDNCKISFDRPTGLLHGHAKRKILVTFHAIKELYYDIGIFCHVYLPLQEMPQYVNLLPETDPLRYMNDDLPVSSHRGITATSSMRAHSKYPYLVIASARSEGLSNPQMWRELQVRKLNYTLCNGRLNTKASGEAIYEDLFCCGHHADSSKAFTFDFGAELVSTSQTIVDLVIKSGNELPIAWRVRLWNDVEVDMENWVMPGTPTEEERRLMLIRKFNLFHVEPRKGYILPGEEQFLRFRYVHIMEGKHVLPAILEVQHGRTIHINLQGRSVIDPPRILVMDTEIHFLKPTPVGVVNPAYQTVELCNRGPCDIEYRLDDGPLEEMMRVNFGFRVLWCQNPVGVIPAQESILLNWMFQPLEPKLYSVRVPVHINNGEGKILMIEGSGVHPQNKFELGMSPPINEPLNVGQTYNWPDLPLILSTELIDFHHVIELSDNHRLLAIQCLSTDCKVEFSWHNSAAIEKNVQGKFQVYPQQGILEPGKQVLCKVNFTAGFQPQVFETTMCLATKRIPIEYEELIEIPPGRPPRDPAEIFIDTWPKRLTAGIYNKLFTHRCVIERFTTTAKLHMTDNARFKLERLEENRDLERNKQLEKEALNFNPPPPIYNNVYLTVRSHICPRVYNATTEDLLSIEERLAFKLPDKTVDEVQMELIFGILLELVQESLQDEMCINSFETFDKIGDRIIFFEDFKKPIPKLDKTSIATSQLDGLPDGTLPEAPPWAGKPSMPQTPCATITGGKDVTDLPEDFEDSVRERTLIALTKTPPPTPPQILDEQPIETRREVPSARATGMAYMVLEEVLFELVKTLFEEDQ
ncbi:unnamed protein product [Calypogeia fissa]